MYRKVIITLLLCTVLFFSACAAPGNEHPHNNNTFVSGEANGEPEFFNVQEEPLLLELLLPSFAAWLPPIKNNVDLNNPQFVWLMDGVEPCAYVAYKSAEWLEAASLVKKIILQGKGEVAARGPWYEIWLQQGIEKLKGRPGLCFYYGPTGNHEPQWVAGVNSGFPESLLLQLNAVYLAPPLDGAPAWLITTAHGLPDERRLNPSMFDIQGYSRSGEVVIIRLDPSPELAELSQLITVLNEKAPPHDSVYREKLERVKDVENAGRWCEAAQSYEEILVSGGFTVQFDPLFWLKLAQARIKAEESNYYVLWSLLQASYLAEQQGKKDLLRETAAVLAAYLEESPRDEMDRYAWQRLVEINPGNGNYWWKLAELFLPALNIAEKIAPAAPGDHRAAGLHFKRAGELMELESLSAQRLLMPMPAAEKERLTAVLQEIGAHIRRGLELEEENPYGIYLEGMYAEIAATDFRFAAAQMEKVLVILPGQPDALRRLLLYEALSEKRDAAVSWDFSRPGEKYGIGGPGVLWSPDGKRLAVNIFIYEPHSRQDLLIVDRERGKITRLEDQPAEFLFWSHDSEWIYCSDYREGLLKKVKWDGSEESLLADGARFPSLSPDGKRIAYSGNGIWVVETSGGPPRQISEGKGDHRPFWYPDSKHLLYGRDSGREGGDGAPSPQVLTRINVDNPGEREELVGDPDYYVFYDWLIPGQVLGVVAGWDDLFSWWMLHQSGEKIDVGDYSLDYYPQYAWLPGTGVAVAIASGQDGISVLEIRDVNGNLLRKKHLSGFEGYPRLERVGSLQASPCGNFLALTFYGADGQSLWVISTGEETGYQLITPSIDGYFSWSPTGSEIAVFNGSILEIWDKGTGPLSQILP
ncbi:MAG: hypothetical protein AB1796_15490 [Bacillota bacterium]